MHVREALNELVDLQRGKFGSYAYSTGFLVGLLSEVLHRTPENYKEVFLSDLAKNIEKLKSEA